MYYKLVCKLVSAKQRQKKGMNIMCSNVVYKLCKPSNVGPHSVGRRVGVKVGVQVMQRSRWSGTHVLLVAALGRNRVRQWSPILWLFRANSDVCVA